MINFYERNSHRFGIMLHKPNSAFLLFLQSDSVPNRAVASRIRIAALRQRSITDSRPFTPFTLYVAIFIFK